MGSHVKVKLGGLGVAHPVFLLGATDERTGLDARFRSVLSKLASFNTSGSGKSDVSSTIGVSTLSAFKTPRDTSYLGWSADDIIFGEY